MKKITYFLIFSILLCLSLFLFFSRERTIEYSSFDADSLGNVHAEENDLAKRMDYHKVPGVSIAVVEAGEIKWAKGYGTANSISGQKVDKSTLFQAGSISKPFAALAALKLVEEGKIDLDEDVNNYLKGWRVPENKFTEINKVTLRGLLSHTAGVTVSGFPGYKQNVDNFPTTEMVLNGQGNTPAVSVDTIPGSVWRYSGGGYTIVEKLVEDVSGLPFEEFMKQHILQPLGMENSTFQQPLPAHLEGAASAAYDWEGNIMRNGLWHNYPEQAAAGLWTTPTDLAKFCIKVHQIASGKSAEVVSKQTIDKMLTRHQNNWGLGFPLYLEGDSIMFQHKGKNAGFTSHLYCFVYQGNALVIMNNGDDGADLIYEIQRSIFNHYNWQY